MEEFKINLFNWYNFKANSEILDFGNNIAKYIDNQNIDTKAVQGKKYDYVIMVGILQKARKEENLLEAVSYLKDDGILLIAENNKFAIKNWNGKRDLTGSLDYREITRAYNSNESGLLSKTEIKKLLKKASLENNKFYYIFPDYNLPNLIFTDNYEVTKEDISRNFESYEEGELVNFNENLALQAIFDEDPEQIKFFANSFLIECSKKEITSNIKYISFTNYRKEEYRIATILTNDFAEKKMANPKAKKHIEDIAENLKYFPSQNSKPIEEFGNGILKSRFIKEVKRFDLYLAGLQDYNEFLNEILKYKDIVYQNTKSYDEVKNKLPEILKNEDENLLKRLKFVEHAFIDMLPKNCFKIGEEYLFFDQEWCENYYPVEYILYRAILNTEGLEEKHDKIFDDLEIREFEPIFEKLEEAFRKKVIDDNMLYDFFNRKVVTREAMIADYKRKIIDRDVEIDKLKVDIEGRKAHVEELLGVINDKENQLIAISNSTSWKITKPLRDISEKIQKIKK